MRIINSALLRVGNNIELPPCNNYYSTLSLWPVQLAKGSKVHRYKKGNSMKVTLLVLALFTTQLFAMTGTLKYQVQTYQNQVSLMPFGHISINLATKQRTKSVTVQPDGTFYFGSDNFQMPFNSMYMSFYGTDGAIYMPISITPQAYSININGGYFHTATKLRSGCHNYSINAIGLNGRANINYLLVNARKTAQSGATSYRNFNAMAKSVSVNILGTMYMNVCYNP